MDQGKLVVWIPFWKLYNVASNAPFWSWSRCQNPQLPKNMVSGNIQRQRWDLLRVPKNRDPWKVAILRTPKHPCYKTRFVQTPSEGPRTRILRAAKFHLPIWPFRRAFIQKIQEDSTPTTAAITSHCEECLWASQSQYIPRLMLGYG